MKRSDYHKKMVKLLRPSEKGRSSGIYNPRTGRYYTARYALGKRAGKNRHFVRNLAEAHDRAKARGVKVPRERFTGGGYKLHKPAPGYAHIGKARVVARVYGRDESGKNIRGARMTFIVNVPMNVAEDDDEMLEIVSAELYAFRFKQEGKKRYIEELDEIEIESVQLALHDKKKGGDDERVPF